MDKNKQLRGLAKGRLAYQEKVKNGDVERLNPIDRAKRKPNSMRWAIDANCYVCVGKENWHEQTKFCTSFNCPFWTLRKGAKGNHKQECLAHWE